MKFLQYWHQVIKINDYQRERFAKKIMKSLFGTVSGKKITLLGWAFKKDTNDTRESAAIYVADLLIENGAEIHVFDPKVSEQQMISDLDYLNSRSSQKNRKFKLCFDLSMFKFSRCCSVNGMGYVHNIRLAAYF